MRAKALVSAAAGLALAGAAMIAPAATAAPLGHPQSFGNAAVDGHVENVRWRGGGGHWHGGRGHWGGPPRGGYYGHRGWGAAPFIGGLAAGAIVGGALAPRVYAPFPGTYVDNYADETYADDNYAGSGDADGYCAQRFRSYDPRSGTYLGYDGQRHPCP